MKASSGRYTLACNCGVRLDVLVVAPDALDELEEAPGSSRVRMNLRSGGFRSVERGLAVPYRDRPVPGRVGGRGQLKHGSDVDPDAQWIWSTYTYRCRSCGRSWTWREETMQAAVRKAERYGRRRIEAGMDLP